MRLKIHVGLLAFAFVCLLCTTVVWPQAGTGELTGLVTDATGGVLPGVEITLTNSATGAVRTTLTSSAGVYRFVAVPVTGSYVLSVAQEGFKAAKVEGIAISVGTTLTKDIRLEVGAPDEIITVSGGAELVQSTESAVSTLIDQSMWQNMPLEVRSQNSFIEFVAGAVPDAMAGSTRGAAVNGARGGTGNYLVEGVDNNEQGQGGRGQLGDTPGGAATSISPDAIGEYRVITNSFSAEYGKAGGFVTDTVLKSGTNEWHGSLFEYNRVQKLAANDFFSNANGLQDGMIRNQFGGSVGGPIIKNKTFFFYSMEFHRYRQASALHAVNTTQQFLDFAGSGGLADWAESDPGGICMQPVDSETNPGLGAPCPGAFAHSRALGPIFNKLKQQGPFPLATSGLDNAGQGFYTYGLTYPVPVYGDVFVSDPYHLNEYRISLKMDHQATENDRISGFYLSQTADSGDPFSGGGNTIGPAYTNEGIGVNIGISWEHTFNPSTLNSFKVGYLRHRSDFPAAEGTLGIPMILTWYDPITVGFGLYAGLPQFFTENQYQFQDSVSVIHGKHSFRAGAEYRRTRNGSSFFNDTFGTFYPYGVEDLITDLAFTEDADMALTGGLANGAVMFASAAVNPATAKPPEVYRAFRANEAAMFFQDDWRLSPRLTINWGMRWEYFGPPHNNRKGIDSNFYFGSPVTPIKTTSTNPYFPKDNQFYAMVSTGTFQVRDAEIWNKDTNNFAPRLGFAYDVLANHKLVLRAGVGIMYDRIYNNVFENIRFNPPFFSDNQIGPVYNGVPVGALSTPGLYSVPFTGTAAFASGYSAKPNPRHMDQNMVTPYYEQGHLGIQYQFFKNYVLETDYVVTLGHKLPGYYDINTFNGRVAKNAQGVALGSTRINTNIGADNYRNNNFWSNYHGLQATVRRNYSNGLALNVNYTFSKALDALSDLFNARGAAVSDTMNLRADYGAADFNMKHRFVAAVIYELPFAKQNAVLGGWQASGSLALQSGVPFMILTSSSSYDLNKNGLNNDRLVYTGSGNPMDSVKSGVSPADGYFDTSQWAKYVCPATVNNGQWCDSPTARNVMTGPGYQNVDLSLAKKFRFQEKYTVEFQANFFNLFNHTNFGLPSGNQTSPSFGASTAAYQARITQLALRFDF